jgi:hypothetical protein
VAGSRKDWIIFGTVGRHGLAEAEAEADVEQHSVMLSFFTMTADSEAVIDF